VSNNNSNGLAPAWVALAGILLILGIFGLGFSYPNKGITWIGVLILLIFFFLVVGYSRDTKGKYWGILVDERNQVSLSRFQMVLWTLIVLSAFLVIGLSRIHSALNGQINLAESLNFNIPSHLWFLLGISATALVGTPLILAPKKDQALLSSKTKELLDSAASKENSDAVNKLDEVQINEAKKEVIESKYGVTDDQHMGSVFIKSEAPSFIDMFKGDELTDKDTINLAKVQMFFFTLIAAFTYGVLIFQVINTGADTPILGFPEIAGGLIVILGISNGGYLTQKAVTNTPEIKVRDIPASVLKELNP